MRSIWLAVLVVLAWNAVPARAEIFDAAANPKASETRPAHGAATPASGGRALPIALGVNSPLGWYGGHSFGASAYVGIGHHHAVRANVARYDYSAPLLSLLDEDVPGHTGKITDVGIGWVFYPRRLWDGLTLEAGLVRRDRDTGYYPEFDSERETQSTTYAGRAMIGWSWLLTQHVFIAVAAGFSIGRETGTVTITPELGMATTQAVSEDQVDAEGYVRIGFAYGR